MTGQHISGRLELSVHGRPVRWVADSDYLTEVVDSLRTSSELAIDTEFVRESTYYPIAGLIQICDRNCCYLVDPVSIESITPLAALLSDTKIVKIMHSCSEDLQLFQHILGVVPRPVFDTQIAAAFVGFGASVGYRKLVETVIGKGLDKSQTRSDWCARPLTSEQLIYAASDVIFLPEVALCLRDRLKMQGTLCWAEEECDRFITQKSSLSLSDQYRQLPGAWVLDRRQLCVLRLLYEWREELARDKDLPRNWIVSDQTLVEIAGLMPEESADLESIKSIKSRTRKRLADPILALVRQANGRSEAELPNRVEPPLSRPVSRKLKELRDYVGRCAEEVGIAPELVLRKRDLEEVYRELSSGIRFSDSQSPIASGWREKFIGSRLKTAIEGIVRGRDSNMAKEQDGIESSLSSLPVQ